MSITIRVGSPGYQGQDNQAIQRTVDAVATLGGGVVEVPAGTYEMHDALHLRSRVTVRGERATILRKVPSVISPLLGFVGYGHQEFRVANPELFRVGMGVHIYDKNAHGFYTTVATITERRGDWFFINRIFNHDYLECHQAMVTSLFSLIEAEGVRDAEVTGLTLDGNAEETRKLNGCRGGAVFCIGSQRLRLRGLEIRHFQGDGISFQQCTDVTMRDCEVHHLSGGGLHPGSGSVRYVMANNYLHDNGGCGIFYCLRTMYSLCLNNRIERNRADGISVGERDTHHEIRGNRVSESGGVGVDFRAPHLQSGDQVVLTGNVLTQNCTQRGDAEITVAGGLNELWLSRNSLTPAAGKLALAVTGPVTRVLWADNSVAGQPATPAQCSGLERGVLTAPDGPPPAVGPAACPVDGATHLGIPSLAPWASADDWQVRPYAVHRLAGNPIIRPGMGSRIGTNINGPSLIRVPDWLPNPLGRYYLYFAHHSGDHIRLAVADDLSGPWRIHEPGVFSLAESGFSAHLASPDVHLLPERREVRMYFHGCGQKGPWSQMTKLAVGRDGLSFTLLPEQLGSSYWRVWQHGGWYYTLEMPGVLRRSRDGITGWEEGPTRFTPNLRHPAVRCVGDRLEIWYSNAFDCPESILYCQMDLRGDWQTWQPTPPVLQLAPETAWEGAQLPLLPSARGLARQPVNQVRDPAIYEEDGRLYLVYSVAGEAGLAIAELRAQ